ncbi:MAG: DsbA family protein [Henriciella sp.]|jgi:2-hydroxychromene-2-carboxylate isomerase
MKSVDVFWSFRSPYSYFSTKRLRNLSKKWEVQVRPRPVYPLAIRTPNFFAEIKPQWVPYLMNDIVRLSQYLELPLGPLNPDPVTMNMFTKEIAAEQPTFIASHGLAYLLAKPVMIKGGRLWTKYPRSYGLEALGQKGQRLVKQPPVPALILLN